MKKIHLLLVILFASVWTSYAQVAINNSGTAPNANAMLDVSSTTKGILIPRMTTTERTAINASLSTTDEGLTVYDTDTQSFWYWDGTDWVAMGSAALTEDKDWYQEGTTDAPTDIDDEMFHEGNVAIGKNTADYKLDVADDTGNTSMKVDMTNTDDSENLRIAGYFNVGGNPATSYGKMGIYSTVGGNPGDHTYATLTGMETDVFADPANNKPAYAYVADISGDNGGAHVGLYNYLHSGGTGSRYGILNYIVGAATGIVYANYTYVGNTGDAIHFGSYKRMLGSGNGVQYGAFNRIGNTGSGKHIGVLNELKSAGESAHVGTVNLLGAGATESNPSVIVPITGDSDGKRVGTVNTIAGDGTGLHITESNNIFSSGDGAHVGVVNVLGHNYLDNTNTATDGYQLGTINNLTDTGTKIHVGTSNLLGYIIDPADPFSPNPVSGDSDARRLGELNMIGGDGTGQHLGTINTILSTGDGEHIGSINVLGYDFDSQTAFTSGGTHYGTLNALNDAGSGAHFGTANFIGYDYINNTEINSDGFHFGTTNILAGGQSLAEGLRGLQVGTINVLVAKTDATAFPSLGKQYGALNVIGRDPQNPFATITNNGDGEHYATYNEVADTGNGLHIASYNKVGPDGTGRHIAIYGEVDASDTGAMAGVFKGYTTAANQVSTINLYSSNDYTVLNTTLQDLTYMEAGFNPVLYNQLGMVQIKVVVRVSSASGLGNKFRLRAQNASGTAYPVTDSDTWTWTETDTTNHKYVVESEWKNWSAGTSPWELHLQGVTDASMNIVNVYVMIRPAQP